MTDQEINAEIERLVFKDDLTANRPYRIETVVRRLMCEGVIPYQRRAMRVWKFREDKPYQKPLEQAAKAYNKEPRDFVGDPKYTISLLNELNKLKIGTVTISSNADAHGWTCYITDSTDEYFQSGKTYHTLSYAIALCAIDFLQQKQLR